MNTCLDGSLLACLLRGVCVCVFQLVVRHTPRTPHDTPPPGVPIVRLWGHASNRIQCWAGRVNSAKAIGLQGRSVSCFLVGRLFEGGPANQPTNSQTKKKIKGLEKPRNQQKRRTLPKRVGNAFVRSGASPAEAPKAPIKHPSAPWFAECGCARPQFLVRPRAEVIVRTSWISWVLPAASEHLLRPVFVDQHPKSSISKFLVYLDIGIAHFCPTREGKRGHRYVRLFTTSLLTSFSPNPAPPGGGSGAGMTDVARDPMTRRPHGCFGTADRFLFRPGFPPTNIRSWFCFLSPSHSANANAKHTTRETGRVERRRRRRTGVRATQPGGFTSVPGFVLVGRVSKGSVIAKDPASLV